MKRTRSDAVVAYEFRSTWYGTRLLTVRTTERHQAADCVYGLGYTTKDIGSMIDLVPRTQRELDEESARP